MSTVKKGHKSLGDRIPSGATRGPPTGRGIDYQVSYALYRAPGLISRALCSLSKDWQITSNLEHWTLRASAAGTCAFLPRLRSQRPSWPRPEPTLPTGSNEWGEAAMLTRRRGSCLPTDQWEGPSCHPYPPSSAWRSRPATKALGSKSWPKNRGFAMPPKYSAC